MRLSAAAFALSVTALARVSFAQELLPMVGLEVEPPPPDGLCPSNAALIDNVSRRMGRNPFAPDATRQITVRYQHRYNGWNARITVREWANSPLAVRDLARRVRTCEEILDSVGLAIALSIDPEAPLLPVTGAPDPTQPEPTCPAETECPPPPPPRIIVRTLPSPPTGVPSSLSLRGGISLGVTPLSFATQLQFRGRHVGLWYATAGAAFTPVTSVDDGATGFGTTSLFGGVCAGTRGSLWRVSGCGGLQVGVLQSVVYTLDPAANGPGERPWVAFFVEGTGRLRIAGPLFVELAARGLVPVYQQRYLVTGRAQQAAFTPSPLGFDLTLGVGFDF